MNTPKDENYIQFIENGPNLPEKLVVEHLNGNVVFICGTGLSCNVGLPTFQTLFKETVKAIGLNKQEIDVIKEEPGDQQFQYLESNFGQKLYIRNLVKKYLLSKQNECVRKTLSSQEAVLTLARHNNKLHLVTTNYDDLFEMADKNGHTIYSDYDFPSDLDNWDGLVYIHGKLNNIKNIVLTSNDFSKGYFNRRKIISFLNRVLDRYSVCFIGYSLDDTLMKYYLGSLDTKKKEKIYAFFENGRYNENVNVINYDNANNHIALHQTLCKWAEFYKEAQKVPCPFIHVFKGINPNEDLFHTQQLMALLKCKDLRYLGEFCLSEPYPSYEWFKEISELKVYKTKKLGGINSIKIYINNEHNSIINTWLSSFFPKLKFIIDLIAKDIFKDKDFNSKIKNILAKYKKTEELKKDSKINTICELWKLYLKGCLIYGQSMLFFQTAVKDFSSLEELTKINVDLLDPISLMFYDIETRCGDNLHLSMELKYFDASEHLDSLKDTIVNNAEKNIRICEKSLNNVFLHLVKIYSVDKFNKMMKEVFPSFSTKPQFGCNWILLIRLICDCWFEINRKKQHAAKRLFDKWIKSNNIIYNRIALYLASYSDSDATPVSTWFHFLTKDNGKALLDNNIEFEVVNLLKNKWKVLDQNQLDFISDLLMRYKEKGIDQHILYSSLRRILSSGCVLRSDVIKIFNELEAIFCESNAVNSKCSCYCGRNALCNQLPSNFNSLYDLFVSDDDNNFRWHLFFGSDPLKALDLFEMANSKGIFIEDKFQIAINEWCSIDHFGYVFELIKTTFHHISSSSLSFVFEKFVSLASDNKVKLNSELFKTLNKLFNKIVLKQCFKDFNYYNYGNIFDEAKRDAFGLYAEVIIHLLHYGHLNKNERSKIYKDILLLCDLNIPHFFYGRIIVVKLLNSLYTINKKWVLNHLKPLMSWKNVNPETCLLWSSFYGNEYFIVELVDDIKETVKHYGDLYNPKNYCHYIFSQFNCNCLTDDDITSIFTDAGNDKKFLEDFSDMFNDWLKSRDRHFYEYNCQNIVVPFVIRFWPKSKRLLNDNTVTNIFKLIVNSGDYFQEAFYSLEWALKEIEYPGALINAILKTKCCSKFPVESLLLINGIVKDDINYSDGLVKAFDVIEQHGQNLKDTDEYRRIKGFADKFKSIRDKDNFSCSQNEKLSLNNC